MGQYLNNMQTARQDRAENARLKVEVDALRQEADWLLTAVADHRRIIDQLIAEKRALEDKLSAVAVAAASKQADDQIEQLWQEMHRNCGEWPGSPALEDEHNG